ncbi:hypothetical protein WOLCODRAFT_135666 [Wolfiporia cocos MD-104 SS10]|uniref:Uncharacterized protein n=1 Tax=Wolfiporia cocos (strain MD-104) TaxID=742152 RepID=A0A2H3IY33_WOLCO|nr:hypothetical protein WOLCODRAFT_135666 [Wolfiporia cocos MD-104 SS10]
MTSRRHPSFEMTMVIHRLYSVASMLIAFTVERNAPQMLYPSHAAGNKLSHALFVLCEARPEDPRFPVTDGAITPGKVGSEIGGQSRSRVSSAASRTALRTARYGRGGISELYYRWLA